MHTQEGQSIYQSTLNLFHLFHYINSDSIKVYQLLCKRGPYEFFPLFKPCFRPFLTSFLIQLQPGKITVKKTIIYTFSYATQGMMLLLSFFQKNQLEPQLQIHFLKKKSSFKPYRSICNQETDRACWLANGGVSK